MVGYMSKGTDAPPLYFLDYHEGAFRYVDSRGIPAEYVEPPEVQYQYFDLGRLYAWKRDGEWVFSCVPPGDDDFGCGPDIVSRQSHEQREKA